MKLSFRVVVVHQHHCKRDAEHHDTADNDLLAMVVIAFDVLGVFFVEFLKGWALVQLSRVYSVQFRNFFVSHIQRTYVGAVVLIKFIGRSSGNREEQGEKKDEERGTRHEV